MASLAAAMIVLHVTTPDCSMTCLRESWGSIDMPLEICFNMSAAWQHSVLVAMAAGTISGHISMARADIPAAMAAVRASIPAIAAGKTMFCVPSDQVTRQSSAVLGHLCLLASMTTQLAVIKR